MMEKQYIVWTLLLCSGIVFWFHQTKYLSTDYKRHPHLLDPQTGKKRNARELFSLANVIKQNSSYINSTSAQQRLYDLQYNTHLTNSINYELVYTSKEKQRKSGWPTANQNLCLRQLDWIVNQLRLHPNYTFEQGEQARQLSNLLDSYGKPPSGLLEGSLNWMGSYTECTKVVLKPFGAKVNTRYCIARTRPSWWPTKEIAFPPTGIHIGICLPETCDTNSFQHSQQHRQLIELLARHELPELYKNELKFESLFCLPDERSPIRQLPRSGRIFLWLVGGWLVVVLIASVMDQVFRKRERLHRILGIPQIIIEDKVMQLDEAQSDANIPTELLRQICSSISIRNCFREFKKNTFKIRYKDGHRVRVDLGALDFIKVSLTILIIMGHASYMGSAYAQRLALKVETTTSDLARMLTSLGLGVGVFFLISGLLSSYTIMRKFNLRQLSNPLVWLAINSGVLLRIAPIFMLVFWYSHSVSPYTFSGPWWDYGVNELSMKGFCTREPWWRSIPHLANIGYPSVPTCILPGWFIASYSQLNLLLPLITYVLIKLPNHLYRSALITFLASASVLSLSLKLYQQTSIPVEAFTIYGGFVFEMMEKFENIGYLSTLGRLGSVAVGAILGYFLRQYEEEKISKWPRWIESKFAKQLVVLLHLLIILLPMIGDFIHLETDAIASLELIVSINAIISIVWPLLNAIAIIQICTLHNHHLLVRFCSHSFWHSFNRLGLCLFLVHWELEFVSLTAFEEGPIQGTEMELFMLGMYGLGASLVVSLLLHILVETPLSRLVMLVGRQFLQQPAEQREGRAMQSNKASEQVC